jgi:hypothetical protein
MSRREQVNTYAKRFHESILAGLNIEDTVKALADACLRAVENETPARTRTRARRIAYLVRCHTALTEAAKKMKEEPHE